MTDFRQLIKKHLKTFIRQNNNGLYNKQLKAINYDVINKLEWQANRSF